MGMIKVDGIVKGTGKAALTNSSFCGTEEVLSLIHIFPKVYAAENGGEIIWLEAEEITQNISDGVNIERDSNASNGRLLTILDYQPEESVFNFLYSFTPTADLSLIHIKISWSSSDDTLIDKNGIVTVPGYYEEDKQVTLTAEFIVSENGESIVATKEFPMTVKKAGE